MNNRLHRILLVIIIFLAIILAGGLFYYYRSAAKLSADNQINVANLTTHRAYYMSDKFFEEAEEQGKSQVKQTEKVYGGIVPHHLMPKDKIAAFFKGLEGGDYETVVLVGPNHTQMGGSNIQVSGAKWETPYGELMPDLELFNNLLDSGNVTNEESIFASEHSISGLVGFIKKYLPDVKVLPIVVKEKVSVNDLDYIAKEVADSTDSDKILFLASVDFSHYMPADAASFHDKRTNSIISNFDYDRVYSTEIDSPGSIYLVLKYLELVGAKQANLVYSTNSSLMVGQPDEPGTSHNYYYFTEGPMADESKIVSLLFFGDIMLDRNVDRQIKENGGIKYLFEKIKGEENRFLRGVDLIGANLEGAITEGGEHYLPDNAYDFAFAPEKVDYLNEIGFNFFTISNNHITDQGELGFAKTQEVLHDIGVDFVGCPDKQVSGCSVESFNIGPYSFGMAGYSMVYGMIDEGAALEQIRQLDKENDFVLVNVHWGVEYQHQFNSLQQNLAYNMIDAGADIIIGHHPHVVQGMEIYKEKPIFYSLGNFIFDQYFSADTQEGVAVGLTVTPEEISYDLFPFVSNESQPVLMTGEQKQEFLDKFKGWSQ